MKAHKGCVNSECKSFVKKIAYKDNYEFCPSCSEKLEYVCADCWKVLEHSTKKYCIACKTKRDQRAEQRIDKVKKTGAAVASLAVLAWNNKDKAVQAGKKVVNLVKK